MTRGVGKSDLSQVFSVAWAKAQSCDWPLIHASCPLSLPSPREAGGVAVEAVRIWGGQDWEARSLQLSRIGGGSCWLLKKQVPVAVGLSGFLLSCHSPPLCLARVAAGLALLHPGV